MKIETLSQKDIRSLMGDQNSFYVIPDYQRPYSWDEENINDFWEDITKAYENKDDNYFLGSFILIKRKDLNGFEIVDGQQRLTTITIFFSVLRDLLANHNENEIAQKIQNEFIKKENKYRLLARAEDRMVFENIVLEKIGSLKNYNNSNLRQQYKKAIELFSIYLEDKEQEVEGKSEKFINYVKNLYEYLLNEVFVIIVVAKDIASAYTIFETINQRGKELNVQDLLKNYLLKKLQDEVARHNSQYPNSQKDFEEEKRSLLAIWQSIENKDEDIDMEGLLNYHRTAILATNPKKDLFKEITNYIRDKNVSVNDFMLDWQKSVDAYLSLYMGKDFEALNDTTKKILSLLWEMNHTHWISVLISARRANMEVGDFQTLVFEIEKMYSLFWISGYNSVKVKYPTWTLIREYINQGKDIIEIKEYIKEIMASNSVSRHFNEEIQSDCYGKRWCRYVLAKYENSLADNTIIKQFNFDIIQIEHILPQTMEADYWASRFTEDEHDQLVNKLGNLTLLAGGSKEKNKSKNQTASNKPYDQKLKVYSGEALKDGLSAFNMTQELTKYKEWTSKAIAERQKLMVEKLKDVWQITEDDIKNEEFISIAEENKDNENEFTEDELKQIDQYKSFLENKFKTKFLDRADDPDVEEKIIARGRCKEDCYSFYGSNELYGDDKYAKETQVPVIYFSKSTYFLDELAVTLLVQVENRKYSSVIDYIKDKNEFADWQYNEKYYLCIYVKVDLNNSEVIEGELVKAYKTLLEIKTKHSADEFENERNIFSLDKGNYSDKELKAELKETLDRDTTLTPRLIKFLEILLSESKTFSREEIKEKLFQKGVGDDEGQAGRYLSNISQFLTKRDNSHLRQIVNFKTGGGLGELKDDYIIVDRYRGMVKEVLDKIS